MVIAPVRSAQTAKADGPLPAAPWTRSPRIADAVLVAVMFLVMVLVAPGPNDDLVARTPGELTPALVALFAGASVALFWRRSHPVVVLGITLAAVLSMGTPDTELVWIAMLVALYSVGRYAGNDRWSHAGLGAVLTFVVVSSVVDGSTLVEISFGLLLMSMLWYTGRRVRLRGEHAAQFERQRAAEAQRAITDERTRIARELHDVVAHRVSLMTVQAGAAKTIVAHDPARAADAMQAVETAGRQALDELRHLLGVLRPETDGQALGPQPGLAGTAGLVEQFRAAGLDVTLTVDDAAIDVPSRVDLSAYRIVQEALTNVLKHAGPDTRAHVRLGIDAHGVTVDVSNDGRAPTMVGGSGHGIIGMRERALLLGGSLDAGPRAGGVFQVVARLPIQQKSS